MTIKGKQMNKFNDYNDLRRFVSDRLPPDTEAYDMSIEELTTRGADNLEDELNSTLNFEFAYGQPLPDDWFEVVFGVGGDDWWKLFE